jgi:hypothetical protein
LPVRLAVVAVAVVIALLANPAFGVARCAGCSAIAIETAAQHALVARRIALFVVPAIAVDEAADATVKRRIACSARQRALGATQALDAARGTRVAVEGPESAICIGLTRKRAERDARLGARVGWGIENERRVASREHSAEQAGASERGSRRIHGEERIACASRRAKPSGKRWR